MAQLAFGVGGAVIGSFFGPLGTSIGFALGSALGAYLFRPDGPTFEGPRLSDLTVPGGAEGTGIPWVRGTMRVPCRVIWSTDIVETRHEEEVEAEGGKGGPPSATQVTYTYSISFAVSVCDAPATGITGIRRLWGDSKLMYSVADGADPATFTANTERGVIRAYNGAETQLPDPLIAAIVGADDAPAYRGTAHVVFDTLQLADFANHRPSIEAEVVVEGAPTSPVHTHAHPDTPRDWNVVGIDSRRNKVLLMQQTWDAGDWVWRWSGGADAPVRHAQIPVGTPEFDATSLHLDVDSDTIVAFLDNQPVNDGFTMLRWDGATGAFLGREVLNPLGTPFSGAPENIRFLNGWGYDRVNKCFWTIGDGTGGGGGTYLVRAAPSAGAAAVQTVVALDDTIPIGPNPLGFASDGDGVLWIACANALVRTGNSPEVFHYGGTGTYSPQKAFGWTARGEIWVPRSASTSLGWRVFNIAGETFSDSVGDLGFAWSTCADYQLGIENGLGYAWFVGKTSGGGPFATLRNTLGAQVHSHNNTTTSGIYLSYIPGVVIATQQDDNARSFFEYSLAQNGIALDALVTEISTLAGAASVGAGSLSSDTVRGFQMARPMPARGALEPLMGAFSFDAAEHDGELTYVKRGGAVAATLTAEDLVTPVTVNRMLESELPATIYLLFANQDLDYNVGVARARRQVTEAKNVIQVDFPIAFNSGEAHQAVDRIMRYAWLERERFELALAPKWRRLEPTDVVTLPDGQRVRLTRVEYSSNGPVKCQAVSDDDGALTSYAVGNPGETGTGVTIDAAGPSVGVVLDLPLLVDHHNDEALYVAACGERAGWSGAIIYYSRDNAVTWQGAAPTFTGARIGAVVGGRMLGRADSMWDHASEITVRLIQPGQTIANPGSLESFYLGANAFAISDDGEDWEICQAYTVTGNADGTYTLRNFLRGRKGTEHLAGAWSIGARLVFLEEGPIKRVAFPLAAIGTESLWRAVGFGGTISDAAEDVEVFDAVSAQPYAPVAIGGAKQAASGDFQLFATRRARKLHEWANSTDVPLDEPSELYQLEIFDDGFSALKRTVTGLSELAYTYTAAMQTADFGGSASRIGVRWRQVSARVGPGIAGEALIPARDSFRFYAPDVAAEWTLTGEQPYVQASKATATNKWIGTNFFIGGGKWYWETVITGSPVAADVFFGISQLATPLSGSQNTSDHRLWRGNKQYFSGGVGRGDGNGPSSNVAAGDVIGLAWDALNGKLWISLNGDWGDNDPEGGTMEIFFHTASAAWRPVFVSSSDNSSYTLTIRGLGRTQFPVPDGFVAIP